MACTANTPSISLLIAAGVLTADVILDTLNPNGLQILATGLTAPTQSYDNIFSATAAGTSPSMTAGFNGALGPTIVNPTITNPSADRPYVGLYVARAVGEAVQWIAGSTATIVFQTSIDAGVTWQSEAAHFYDGVPAAILGYGCHMSTGAISVVAGGSYPAGQLQVRMYGACTSGGGNFIHTGDLSLFILMVNT